MNAVEMFTNVSTSLSILKMRKYIYDLLESVKLFLLMSVFSRFSGLKYTFLLFHVSIVIMKIARCFGVMSMKVEKYFCPEVC
jgi:uncharacterized membrane protein